FRIRNRHHFASLDRYRGEWGLEADGVRVAGGGLPALHVAPGESLDVTLDLQRGDGERFVTFRFFVRGETEWAAAGHEVATQQLPVASARAARWRSGSATLVDVEEGVLPGLVLDGPHLQLWRAPTDNDGLPLVENRGAGPLERWLELGLDRLELELVSARRG